MEISPARDGKYFMRVIWVEWFFLIWWRWAGFMSWLSPSGEADWQPLRLPRLGEVWGRHPLPLTLMGLCFLTLLPGSLHHHCVSCVILIWMSLCVSFFLFYFTGWSDRWILYFVAWLSCRVVTHDTTFHLLFFVFFPELFWRTVSAMGLRQEGWEPHEEQIWQYHCMYVQSTSTLLMYPPPPTTHTLTTFICLIYWLSLWLDGSKLLKQSFYYQPTRAALTFSFCFYIHLVVFSVMTNRPSRMGCHIISSFGLLCEQNAELLPNYSQ